MNTLYSSKSPVTDTGFVICSNDLNIAISILADDYINGYVGSYEEAYDLLAKITEDYAKANGVSSVLNVIDMFDNHSMQLVSMLDRDKREARQRLSSLESKREEEFSECVEMAKTDAVAAHAKYMVFVGYYQHVAGCIGLGENIALYENIAFLEEAVKATSKCFTLRVKLEKLFNKLKKQKEEYGFFPQGLQNRISKYYIALDKALEEFKDLMGL